MKRFLCSLPLVLLGLGGCAPLEMIRLYFQEQQYSEDQAIIAQVRGALWAAPDLDATGIAVDAYLKDVTLTGTVATPAQAAQAEALAAAVSGVDSVQNQLQVR